MRKPDFVIGRAGAPYLERWWVIPRNRWFNIYLHHFLSAILVRPISPATKKEPAKPGAAAAGNRDLDDEIPF